MKISIVIFTIFVPALVMVLASAIRYLNNKTDVKMTDNNFTVRIPGIVTIIGTACSLISVLVILGFTIFSTILPHIIFYITFGLFYCLGAYLALKSIRWHIVVKEHNFTVYPLLGRAHTYAFSDVNEVKRQVKKNHSERIVIRTITNRKIIVEDMEIAYTKYRKKIQTEAPREILSGFDTE